MGTRRQTPREAEQGACAVLAPGRAPSCGRRNGHEEFKKTQPRCPSPAYVGWHIVVLRRLTARRRDALEAPLTGSPPRIEKSACPALCAKLRCASAPPPIDSCAGIPGCGATPSKATSPALWPVKKWRSSRVGRPSEGASPTLLLPSRCACGPAAENPSTAASGRPEPHEPAPFARCFSNGRGPTRFASYTAKGIACPASSSIATDT